MADPPGDADQDTSGAVDLHSPADEGGVLLEVGDDLLEIPGGGPFNAERFQTPQHVGHQRGAAAFPPDLEKE